MLSKFAQIARENMSLDDLMDRLGQSEARLRRFAELPMPEAVIKLETTSMRDYQIRIAQKVRKLGQEKVAARSEARVLRCAD